MHTFEHFFDVAEYRPDFITRYRLASQCNHPDHPGCPVCDPEGSWLCYRLTREAQAVYEEFINDPGHNKCSCELNAPCTNCCAEGNPENLLCDYSAWEQSTDPSLTSFDWLLNQ